MDYELNNKDIVVLSSESTEMVKSLKDVSVINLPSHLRSPLNFTKPETGYLFPYDVGIFDQMIMSAVSS